MDCSACALCFTAILGGLLLFLAYLLKQRRDHFSQFIKLGIPGPEPSLIWGNLPEIREKTQAGAQKEWHKLYGPIVGYYFGYQPCLLISDREVLKNILLKDFLNFADRSNLFIRNRKTNTFAGLTELKGQRWKTVRSTLTPSFTSSKLKQLSPEVAHFVDDFIANVAVSSESGAEFDIYELYQALTLDTICRSAMGVNFGIQKDVANSEILQELKAIFELNASDVRLLLSCFPWIMDKFGRQLQNLRMRLSYSGKNPVEELQRRCKDVVKMRRTNPATRRLDLLQLMMDANGSDGVSDMSSLTAGDEAEHFEAAKGAKSGQCPMSKDKGLTEDELIANAFVVLLAGYETTSSTLAFITRVLLRFPDVQETIRQELLEATDNGKVFEFERLQKCHYLESVIQETMRMYPPVHSFTSRTAADEKTYNGITIPKDMGVYVSTMELHYDEEVFPDPHEFKPTRFLPENKTPAMNFSWMPFGAGPRNCIGMRFAQMEIKITLAKLLTKYRLVSNREPIGDIKIAVIGKPNIQQIKDPLLCRVEPLAASL